MKGNYRYIQAWGEMMGSREYYISQQITEAKDDEAPENAIYKREQGSWETFDKVTNKEAIAQMNIILRDMQQ